MQIMQVGHGEIVRPPVQTEGINKTSYHDVLCIFRKEHRTYFNEQSCFGLPHFMHSHYIDITQTIKQILYDGPLFLSDSCVASIILNHFFANDKCV